MIANSTPLPAPLSAKKEKEKIVCLSFCVM